MSKSSRARWNAKQKELHLQKAQALAPRTATVSVPLLSQVENVSRNPFTPSSIEPRGNAQVKAHALLTQEYVPSGITGYYPFLRALPPYIDDITQQFGISVYEQMMTDPIVRASIGVFKMAIIANDWELVPSLSRDEHDYAVAVQMRDFIKENLDGLETAYDIILEQHLNALAFGSSVNEQIYSVEEMPYTRAGRQLRLKDIRDKPLQNTIFVVDSFLKTVGILTQRFPGQNFPAGSYIPIDFSSIGTAKPGEEFDLSDIIPGFLPRSKFSILSNEVKLNDERGHSKLRAAYAAWWFKQQETAEYLSYLSKHGTPSLVGTTAPGAQPQVMLDANLNPQLDTAGNPIMKTPEQVLSDALTAFQNGSAIAVPNGSTIAPLQVNSDGAAHIAALNWCDKQIAEAVTYQFLGTLEGEHQARASSEVHQDILSLTVLRLKLWLAKQQYREVFKRLLMYNFDLTGQRIARYIPKLSLGLGDGFPVTPDSIAALMQSGYFGSSPDPVQMEKLDDRLGLPRRETGTTQYANPIDKAGLGMPPMAGRAPFVPNRPRQSEFARPRRVVEMEEDYDG